MLGFYGPNTWPESALKRVKVTMLDGTIYTFKNVEFAGFDNGFFVISNTKAGEERFINNQLILSIDLHDMPEKEPDKVIELPKKEPA